MAKFLIFSDIHIHPWTAYATVTKRGLNSRLVGILNLLKRILVLASEQNCDGVLFSGDLFHLPKISVETYDLTVRALRETQVPIVMIPGNHDEASRMAEFHSMRALKGEKVYVLDSREGDTLTLAGTTLGGIPFTPDVDRLLGDVRRLRRCQILLCHTGFAGASAGFDYIADQKNFATPESLKTDGLVIAGHFHQPQMYLEEAKTFAEVEHLEKRSIAKLKYRILIPGAPLQHTFGDRGSVRGCWLYETRKQALEFLPLQSAKFVKMKIRSKEAASKEKKWSSRSLGNYVHCTVYSKEEYAYARDLLTGTAKGFTLKLEQESDQNASKRLNIGRASKTSEILEAYLEKISAPEGLSKEGLMRVGADLLSRAAKGEGTEYKSLVANEIRESYRKDHSKVLGEKG